MKTTIGAVFLLCAFSGCASPRVAAPVVEFEAGADSLRVDWGPASVRVIPSEGVDSVRLLPDSDRTVLHVAWLGEAPVVVPPSFGG